ncbi:thiamine pyrophosphate-binding protein [Arthrobacter sp. NPDC080031]|uniref:thiamine pyrophosphate-binding protein n=1 Tax=Arthrobacter sp. NPDC080031 TaxID=3155918 RepID=UPI00344FE004
MKLYEAMASMIAKLDSEVLFGLMGDANLHMICDYRKAGGRYIRTVHEAGAVSMADAYHRSSGRTGLATITHGPGLTNAMTALTEAARARSEVLVISGSTPAEPTNPQRIDLAQIAATAGALYERAYKPETIGRDLTRALQRMKTSRLPVLFDVPSDFQSWELETPQIAHMPHAQRPRSPFAAEVEPALELILASERPIIIAGRGAVVAEAEEELAQLAEQTGALLGTTIAGKELFRSNARSIGIVGGLSDERAAAILSDSDCLIAFGAALNNWTSFDGTITQGKRVVQIDQDGAAINAYTPVDCGVIGDVRAVAATMNEILSGNMEPERSAWLARMTPATSRAAASSFTPAVTSPGTVDIREAATALNKVLPADIAFVSDVGRFNVGTWPYLHAASPEALLTMNYFASLGLGISGAAGISAARPGKPTLLAVGDGGLMMGVGELATLVRESFPVIVTAWNDDSYGFEHFRLERYGFDADYSSNDFSDLAALAAGMGMRARTIRSIEDIEQAAELWTNGLTGPVFLDIKIDPHHNLIHW